MSIRWNVVILLSVVSSLFVASTYLVQRRVIVPGFARVERGEAGDDLIRCEEALRRESEHLSVKAQDWASWDDTYQYVQDRNPQYETNLIATTFVNNRIDFLAVLRLDGEVVWAQAYDRDRGEFVPVPEPLNEINPGHPLICLPNPQSLVSGILVTRLGPMQLGSRPILTSDNVGPVRGALIMGRLLGDAQVAELAAQTRVSVRLSSVPDEGLAPDDQRALTRLASAGPDARWIEEHDTATLYGYTVFRDLFGRPALLLRAALPRTITARGMSAARAATVTSLAGGLAVLLAVGLYLHWSVIKPLLRFTEHAVRVGTQDDLRARLNNHSKDEIGILAREFDRMVGSLAASREKMVDVAHRSGMAEVAVEMLHNIGNVLNSVNVSANLVTEQLHRSEVPTLARAAALMLDQGEALGSFITRDERGRQLPVYLAELAKCLTAEQDMMLKEMARLGEAIDHIKQIVDSQKSRSVGEELVETLAAADLLEEAVRLNAELVEKHRINVVRQCDCACDIRVNKHKVLQILINLVTNACQALENVEGPDKQIVLKLEIIHRDNEDRVRIFVADNGVGIPEDKLAKIFAFGFSTRQGGQGYGLHSAANMAKEIGGGLVAASDGVGQGAVFRLEFPVHATEVSQ